MMKIIQIFLKNSLRNFNYILYSEKTKEAIVFDPYDMKLIDETCSLYGITPKYLINTHSHPDHIRGNVDFLTNSERKHVELKDGEFLVLSPSEKILCKSTPGHVKEHYCYYIYNQDNLDGVITGDTVFNAGVGNCRDGGDPKVLYQSIKSHFYGLKDEVCIYPSHDYFSTNLEFAQTIDLNNMHIEKYLKQVNDKAEKGEFLITTIGEEKQYNPFFRAFNADFLKSNNYGSAEEAFIDIRRKRDNW